MFLNSLTITHTPFGGRYTVILCKYTLNYYIAQTIPNIFSQNEGFLTFLTLPA
jgi:hypothetical protein